MKRIIGLCAVLAGFFAVGLIAESLMVLKVKTETASVRSKPEISSEAITQVEFGTLFESSKKIGNFYEISIIDKDGKSVPGFLHASVVEVLIMKDEKTIAEEEKAKEPAPKLEIEPQIAEEEKAKKLELEVKPKRVEQIHPGFKRMGLGLFVGSFGTSDYGNGLAYGANLYLGITRNIGIELAGLNFEMTAKENADIGKISKGKLAVIPLQISLMARFPIGAKIVSYVAGGVGYYLNKFTLDGNLVRSWSDLGLDLQETVNHAVGYHLGVGLDYFFSPSIAIAANVKYCLAMSKGSWTLKEQVSLEETKGTLGDLKLSTLVFGAGLKFCF